MRTNLREDNMDLVMHITRKYNKKLVDVMDFILDNPELIMITRGELNEESYKKRSKTYKK